MPRAHGNALPPAERVRLAHVLNRLASDFDGERAAAGLIATKIVRTAGLTWDAVLSPGAPTAPPPPPIGWRAQVAWCAERPELLTAWDIRFLDGMARFAAPSAKQQDILDGLVARRVAAEAGL